MRGQASNQVRSAGRFKANPCHLISKRIDMKTRLTSSAHENFLSDFLHQIGITMPKKAFTSPFPLRGGYTIEHLRDEPEHRWNPRNPRKGPAQIPDRIRRGVQADFFQGPKRHFREGMRVGKRNAASGRHEELQRSDDFRSNAERVPEWTTHLTVPLAFADV